MSARRVVVTGLGATTPLGGDVATTWSALLAGKSGVRLLTEDWAQTIPVHFAARVAVEPSEQMERVEMRRLDRSEQFALIASREAWKDAGSPEMDKERLGVVIASGIGGVTTLLDQYDILREKGARFVSPHTVPMLMPNGPAANVGLELQAKAGVHTPVSACASGAEAIGYALDMIRNNRADVVVSGGVDEYEVIFGSKDPEENLATVAALGVKTVIMTAGPDEMRILHEGKRFNYTPVKVKLVDPVGSGDAFISGTISGLIGGLSIEDAIAQGSKCGAAVAATRGDWALMITGEKGILNYGGNNG